MTSLQRKRIVPVVLSVLVLTGIFMLIARKVKARRLLLPELTKVTLVRIDIHSDTVFLTIFAIAQNKSPWTMHIDSILCTVSLGGVPLVKEQEAFGLVQHRNQSDTIAFTVRIPVDKTRKTIAGLQDKEYTGLGFDAAIVYNTRRFGRKRIHLSRERMVEVPVPPRLQITRTERRQLRLLLREVDVDLYLRITNEGNQLNLIIRDLNYALTLGKDLHTAGKFGKDIDVRPRSSILLRFPLEFEMKQPIATIFKTWSDTDRVPFRLVLKGNIHSPKIGRVPVELIGSGYAELVKDRTIHAEKRQLRTSRRNREKT